MSGGAEEGGSRRLRTPPAAAGDEADSRSGDLLIPWAAQGRPDPLATLWTSVRRQWIVALLVAVSFAAASLWSIGRLPDEYESLAVLAFAPRLEARISADIVRITLPKYAAYAESDASIREVSTQAQLSRRQLSSALEVAIPPDTANLELQVTAPRPETAARAVNLLAERTLRLATGDQLLTGEVVVPGTAPDEPAGPRRRLLAALALLAAGAVGVLAAYLRDRLGGEAGPP